MSNTFSKEELLHSLPDFAAGCIENPRLSEAIESEIALNPEFRNELEEIKFTLGFMSSAELEAPGDAYFNNLSARINEKTSSDSIPVRIKDKISNFWKILIPALTLILISVFIYKYYPENTNSILTETNKQTLGNDSNADDNTKITTDKEAGNKTFTDKIKNDSDQNLNSNAMAEKNKETIPETNKDKSVQKNFRNQKSTSEFEIRNNTIKINPNDLRENDLLAFTSTETEDTDDTNSEIDNESILSEDEENGNEFSEDEFLELSPEEQQEIIETLKKS